MFDPLVSKQTVLLSRHDSNTIHHRVTNSCFSLQLNISRTWVGGESEDWPTLALGRKIIIRFR